MLSFNLMIGEHGSSSMCDPLFANVELLMHMDGLELGQSFLDSSSKTRQITPTGSAHTTNVQGKFAQSGAFDGNGDYVTVVQNSSLQLDTLDFCVEVQLYRTTSNMAKNDTILGMWGIIDENLGFIFHALANGALAMSYNSGTFESIITPNGVLPYNQWAHVAFTRESGLVRVFVDGVEVAQKIIIDDLHSTANLLIGVSGDTQTQPQDDFEGYMDEIRYTVGAARYTSNFTPPDAPFSNVAC